MALIQSDGSAPVQALLERFALIYLPIVIVCIVAFLTGIHLDEQTRVGIIEARENFEIELIKTRVRQDFAEVDADLRIFAKLPSLQHYLDSGNPLQREEMGKMFLSLAEEKRYLDKVRYLDASGQEIIRINFNDGKPAIVPREQLRNKSARYFFRDTFSLNEGEVYVSPLDLNVEENKLEIPYKPTIRFGTPVFDGVGRKKGILLFNYFGSKPLQDLHTVMRGIDHGVMLLNSDGYWLFSNTNHADEWGFLLGKNDRTFGHDFPDEWRTLSTSEQGTLLTDKGLFIYGTVHPLVSGEKSSTGSDLILGASQHEVTAHEYNWKIVSFIPIDVLSSNAFYNKTGDRIWLVIGFLLLTAFAWIIALVTLMRKQAAEKILRQNEELELKVQERTKQLLGAQEELVRKEKLAVLGQIVGSVGHELRNPLGVMSNAVYFLQTVLSDADETTKEYLNIIKSEIAASEIIVSDLLDSVRTKPPRPAMINVKELLEKTLAKCAVPSSVTVKMDIPEKLSPLRGDPQQIHQVFRNLISNGIDAMPQGGELEIRAVENTQEKNITLSVRDAGVGIAPEVLPMLFQPLFTTKARGIGLGLVVVNNLVQANGGAIKVESEMGKGTVFTVTFPAAGE